MRIAVASADGVSISQHFGRSACFIVFHVEDGKIIGSEVRDNTFTAFAKGECGNGKDHRDRPSGHAAIVNALQDCDIVLCQGMGWRAAEELKAHGIQPYLIESNAVPEEVVAAYLAGSLRPVEGFCRCHE